MKTKQKKMYYEDSSNCETPFPLIGNTRIYSPNEEINFHSSKSSSMSEEQVSESSKPFQDYRPEN